MPISERRPSLMSFLRKNLNGVMGRVKATFSHNISDQCLRERILLDRYCKNVQTVDRFFDCYETKRKLISSCSYSKGSNAMLPRGRFVPPIDVFRPDQHPDFVSFHPEALSTCKRTPSFSNVYSSRVLDSYHD